MSSKKGSEKRIVVIDNEALNSSIQRTLGRKPSKRESEVIDESWAIMIDATACGRTIAETVANADSPRRKVSDAVKAYLGLIPSPN